MDINKLIAIIKKKITEEVLIENIKIEDKSFIHKNHPGNQKDKFHLKIMIESAELASLDRVKSNQKIHKILEDEIKNYIHSIQILIL